MKNKVVISLIWRYILIILLGLGNLWVFYTLFKPLTVGLTATILSIFSQTSMLSGKILFDGILIEIIPACVAGSAYYLLTILLFSTPNIKLARRGLILVSTFLAFFIFNVLRLVILALINKSIYFETIHLIFWYALSTLFVVIIWVLSVKYFKIKDTPIYTDVKTLLKLSKKPSKKPKKGK
jgi:exosortase/archaeosortase family protein